METEQTSLHFFCGKMAAGKSTMARELATKFNAVLLVEDDWLSQLFHDEITDIPSYIQYSGRLTKLLSNHIITLLSHDVSLVLDFPANTKKQRNWFRDIIERSNTPHTLHFVDASDSLCKKQLLLRSKNKPQGAAFTSDAEFDEITKYFQDPDEAEGFNIIHYQNEHEKEIT